MARVKKPVAEPANFYEAVYRLVRKIPRGRVMTYGQIAVILGHPRASRAVGYALRACSGKNVPWQRVINAQGQISTRAPIEGPLMQKVMLKAEGVRFDASDRCDLAKYRWEPPQPERYRFETTREFPL